LIANLLYGHFCHLIDFFVDRVNSKRYLVVPASVFCQSAEILSLSHLPFNK